MLRCTFRLHLLIIALLLLLGYSKTTSAQIKLLSFQQLQALIPKANDTTTIVHFWASWCIPCVKELPALLPVSTKSSKPIKLVLVSLDFSADTMPLHRCMQQLNIKQPVYLLQDLTTNTWINAVDSTWSGALPATWILGARKKQLIQDTLTLNELLHLLKSFY